MTRRRGAAPSTLRVRACTSLAELESLAPALDRLNDSSPRPCPFSTFAFYKAYVENDHDKVFDGVETSILVLLAYRAEELVGFLPLRRAHARVFGRPVTIVTWLATHDNDRPHLVARAADEMPCAEAFIAWLRADRMWSALVLPRQDDGSPLRPAIRTLLGGRCFVTEQRDLATAVLTIDCSTTEEYFRSLSAKMRSDLARLARRLFGAGDVGLVTSDDPLVLEQLMGTYLDVEARSWKAGTAAAVGFGDKRRDFFRHSLMGHAGVLPEMAILTLDRAPIAAIVCGTFGTTSYALKMAYDESFASLAPGRFLMFLSVAGAIRAQRDAYNMLNGFEDYKSRLGADIIEKRTLQVFRVSRLPFLSMIARRIRHRVRGGEHAARRRHITARRRTRARRIRGVDPTHLAREAHRLDTITHGPGRAQHLSHDELARGLPFSID